MCLPGRIQRFGRRHLRKLADFPKMAQIGQSRCRWGEVGCEGAFGTMCEHRFCNLLQTCCIVRRQPRVMLCFSSRLRVRCFAISRGVPAPQHGKTVAKTIPSGARIGMTMRAERVRACTRYLECTFVRNELEQRCQSPTYRRGEGGWDRGLQTQAWPSARAHSRKRAHSATRRVPGPWGNPTEQSHWTRWRARARTADKWRAGAHPTPFGQGPPRVDRQEGSPRAARPQGPRAAQAS